MIAIQVFGSFFSIIHLYVEDAVLALFTIENDALPYK